MARSARHGTIIEPFVVSVRWRIAIVAVYCGVSTDLEAPGPAIKLIDSFGQSGFLVHVQDRTASVEWQRREKGEGDDATLKH